MKVTAANRPFIAQRLASQLGALGTLAAGSAGRMRTGAHNPADPDAGETCGPNPPCRKAPPTASDPGSVAGAIDRPGLSIFFPEQALDRSGAQIYSRPQTPAQTRAYRSTFSSADAVAPFRRSLARIVQIPGLSLKANGRSFEPAPRVTNRFPE